MKYIQVGWMWRNKANEFLFARTFPVVDNRGHAVEHSRQTGRRILYPMSALVDRVIRRKPRRVAMSLTVLESEG